MTRICGQLLGSKPSWMSDDQYEQCTCQLPKGHRDELRHRCGAHDDDNQSARTAYLESKYPRLPDPTPERETPPHYSTADLPLDYFTDQWSNAQPVGTVLDDGDAGTWVKGENEWIEL